MKRKYMLFAAIAVIAALGVTVMIISNNRGYSEDELRALYRRQNSAFLSIVNLRSGGDSFGYLPINIERPNASGIDAGLYIGLIMFERHTGNILTKEQVFDYFSQEFEDDGEVRIFTNGRHPEIAAFIEWREKYSPELHAHVVRISNIYFDYAEAQGEDFPRFAGSGVLVMPTEMLDEILEKDINPDHVLDLTSIQDRYMEAGLIWLGEDGITLEFNAAER